MTNHPHRADHSGAADQLPEDIQLDEAARNWVARQSAEDPGRSLRFLAADAALTAAIGRAYGAD
ncbi:MAG: hypothetical protein ACRDX8_04815 [Acidimicrobiales bacterium]